MECHVTRDFPSDFSDIVMVELARELLLSARTRLGRPPPARTQLFEVLGAFAYAIAPVINNIDSADRGTMRDWFVNVLDLLVEELRHRSHANSSGTGPAEEGRAIRRDAAGGKIATMGRHRQLNRSTMVDNSRRHLPSNYPA